MYLIAKVPCFVANANFLTFQLFSSRKPQNLIDEKKQLKCFSTVNEELKKIQKKFLNLLYTLAHKLTKTCSGKIYFFFVVFEVFLLGAIFFGADFFAALAASSSLCSFSRYLIISVIIFSGSACPAGN